MKKRELYDSLESLEEVLSSSLTTISLIKKNIKVLIENNNALEHENDRLRERLKSFEPKDSRKKEDSNNATNKRTTLQMLEELYNDGFHVCHPFYGQIRENDAPCAFCLEFWAELTEDKA